MSAAAAAAAAEEEEEEVEGDEEELVSGTASMISSVKGIFGFLKAGCSIFCADAMTAMKNFCFGKEMTSTIAIATEKRTNPKHKMK